MTFLCHDINSRHESILSNVNAISGLSEHQYIQIRVFITPGLATWLEDGHPFLKDLTRQIIGNSAEGSGSQQHLHYIVAVVDRLPGPCKDDAMKDTISLKHLSLGFGGQYEGFCFHAVHGDVDPEDALPIAGHTSSLCKIEIRGIDQSSHSERPFDWAIALQPANTLFLNGQTATMFQMTAQIRSDTSSSASFSFSPRTALRSIRFTRPQPRSQQLFAPLVALTSPRRVKVSMGNVISQIEGPVAEQRDMPASTELEPAVSGFLRKYETPSTQVFAYIRHATDEDDSHHIIDKMSSVESTDGRAPTLGTYWAHALRDGVVRKVTGGGGGWGKKKGLLSFDPSIQLGEGDDVPGLFDHGLQSSRRLSNIAQPGDTVQFFASLPWLPHDETAKTSFGTHSLATDPGLTAPTIAEDPNISMESYGKIPSTTDWLNSTPPTATVDDNDNSPAWTVIPNFFGMLSEQNVAISGTSNEPSESYARSTGLDSPYQRGSRLNVPYATVTNIYSG